MQKMSAVIYALPGRNATRPTDYVAGQTPSMGQSESNALLNMFIQALTQKAITVGAVFTAENQVTGTTTTTTTAVDFVVDTLFSSSQANASNKAAGRLKKMITHDPTNKPIIVEQLAKRYHNATIDNPDDQTKLKVALNNAGLTGNVNLALHTLALG